jgi:hypothetical protein
MLAAPGVEKVSRELAGMEELLILRRAGFHATLAARHNHVKESYANPDLDPWLAPDADSRDVFGLLP